MHFFYKASFENGYSFTSRYFHMAGYN